MIQFRGGAPVQRRRGYPSVEKFYFSKLSELHVGDAVYEGMLTSGILYRLLVRSETADAEGLCSRSLNDGLSVVV